MYVAIQSVVPAYNIHLHLKYLTTHLANKVGGDHQATQAIFHACALTSYGSSTWTKYVCTVHTLDVNLNQ